MMSRPRLVTVSRSRRAVTIISRLVVVVLLIGGTISAARGETPAEKCARSKIKAAEKKTSSKLRCYQKALQKGVGFDIPLCAAAADARLLLAFAKAEQKGGCNPMAADEALIETKVDNFVADIVNNLPPEGTPVATPTATCPGPCPTCTPGGPCPSCTPQPTVTYPGPCPTPTCATRSADFERTLGASLFVPDDSQTGLDLNSDFTVEMWVKMESAPSGAQQYGLFGKREAGEVAYSVLYENPGGSSPPFFSVRTSSDGSAAQEVFINYTLPVGSWRHLAFLYTKATGTIEIYVNGSSIGSKPGLATALHNSAAPFMLGKPDSFGTALEWDGLIDEVRVWNDLRTEAEIVANMGTEIACLPTDNLVSYWKLDCDFGDCVSGNDLSPWGSSPIFDPAAPF